MIKECDICFHTCRLEEGQAGLCKARMNVNGEIRCTNYGRITAIALDPIEKKPLNRFYPGSFILSAGSYGCNLHCPFCQNHEISMPKTDDDGIGDHLHGLRTMYYAPRDLITEALRLRLHGNIGIAYTYNEPFISYEYLYDCSVLAHKEGLKNVVVTNGTVNQAPFLKLIPYIDAMNIDLKSFRPEVYRTFGGDLDAVKQTIETAAACPTVHVEITTLIIPGYNDSEEEMRELTSYLAGIDPDLTLHVSRFFPRYKMNEIDATPIKTVYKLAEVARDYLDFVYEGNC